jgi:hypothetical protein
MQNIDEKVKYEMRHEYGVIQAKPEATTSHCI